MTASQHADKASRLLDPPAGGSPGTPEEAIAHALVAIALAITSERRLSVIGIPS